MSRKSALSELPMWIVTQNPTDFPGLFVARKNVWDESVEDYVPTEEAVVKATYDDLHEEMTRVKHLTFLMRYPHDAPNVLGVFL